MATGRPESYCQMFRHNGAAREWGEPATTISRQRPTAGDTEQQTRYPFSLFAVCFVGLPAVPQDFHASYPGRVRWFFSLALATMA